MLLEHFGGSHPQGRLHAVYHTNRQPAELGALARSVQAAFGGGDEVAIGILRGAANELESSALSVARRLKLVGQPFTFLLAGGIFRAVPWLEENWRAGSGRAPGSHHLLESTRGADALALQEARGGAHVPAYKVE
jgi:N-acetylglucosamine kinase-like BadF-type ATPase